MSEDAAAGPPAHLISELFARSPFPTLIVDHHARCVVAANPAFARLLGHGGADSGGTPLHELGLDDEAVEELLAPGDERPRYGRLSAGDGSEVDVELRVVPVGDVDDALVAVFARGVADERQAERDRIRLQSQLWMAQKHEAVGRLAAGIAHDFNNLLSTVLLTTESLRDRLGPMEWGTMSDLDVIVDAGLKARDLTRELLAFSGRQMLKLRPVSMNRIVTDMRALLRRTLPEDIDLVLRPSTQPAAVNADPAQMQQVLLNLVVNARDAMPSGGHLVIQVHEVELDADFARDYVTVQPGPHVMLSVTDTGMGMDAETQARIFEPFFSTRERGAGTGLGLATVYGIVKQSGGSIWVTSEPGVGTTFRIYLPRVAASELPERSAAAEVDVNVVGGTEHILVVEDEESVRRTTARILRELGYQVSEAADPGTAMELHDELWPREGHHPVDVVLTDVIMPGMSGVELARRLHEKREDLPVLYMTGYLDPGGEDERLEERVVIPKPFTRAELARRVREALEGRARA